jgi:hypothetical protein
MVHKKFLVGMAAVLLAFGLAGCPPEGEEPGDGGPVVTPKSDDAAITGTGQGVWIAGERVSFDYSDIANDGSAFEKAYRGTVHLVTDSATGQSKIVLPAGASATVYVSDNAVTVEDDLSETTPPGTDGVFSFAVGDASATKYVYIKVTAEDGTAFKWYAVTVDIVTAAENTNLGEGAVIKGRTIVWGPADATKDGMSAVNGIPGTAAFWKNTTATSDLKAPTGDNAGFKAYVLTTALTGSEADPSADAKTTVADLDTALTGITAPAMRYVYIEVTSSNGNKTKWYAVTVTVEALSSDTALEAGVKIKGKAVTWEDTGDGNGPATGKAGDVTLKSGATGSSDFKLPEGATVQAYASSTLLTTEPASGGENSATAFDTAFTVPAGPATWYVYLKVTAENGTAVYWYKITVTVNAPAAAGEKWTLLEGEEDIFSDDFVHRYFGIAYGNNTFVALCNIGNPGITISARTSSDGITWEKQETRGLTFNNGGTPTGIVFGGATFVAWDKYDKGKIALSSDGITWTMVTLNSLSYNIARIVYVKNMFVAMMYNNGTKIAYSENKGETWTEVETAPGNIYEMVYSHYVDDISCMAYGGTSGIFVTAGGRIQNGSPRVAQSADGKTSWTGTDTDSFPGGMRAPTDIAANDSVFVAIDGMGAMATSPDGTTWTGIDGNFYGEHIFYNGSRFVVFGSSPFAWAYSTDDTATEWSDNETLPNPAREGESQSPLWVNGIAYGNGTFVVVSDNGRIAYALDEDLD